MRLFKRRIHTGWEMPEKERELRPHIKKIEKDARWEDPNEARERIIGLATQLRAGENDGDEKEFDKNLRATTVSGAIGFGGFAVAEALQKAGHDTAASAALKFGISAIAPYAFFGLRAWKTANDLRKIAYRRIYPRAREHAKNLEDRELKMWARHAAAARKRTTDPELEAWATAILHATVEEMRERGMI